MRDAPTRITRFITPTTTLKMVNGVSLQSLKNITLIIVITRL